MFSSNLLLSLSRRKKPNNGYGKTDAKGAAPGRDQKDSGDQGTQNAKKARVAHPKRSYTSVVLVSAKVEEKEDFSSF